MALIRFCVLCWVTAGGRSSSGSITFSLQHLHLFALRALTRPPTYLPAPPAKQRRCCLRRPVSWLKSCPAATCTSMNASQVLLVRNTCLHVCYTDLAPRTLPGGVRLEFPAVVACGTGLQLRRSCLFSPFQHPSSSSSSSRRPTCTSMNASQGSPLSHQHWTSQSSSGWSETWQPTCDVCLIWPPARLLAAYSAVLLY